MYRSAQTTPIRVLRLRVKDKHAAWLSSLAREVNTVFNYCNELSLKVFERARRFLSGFDFWPFLKGAACCGECALHLPVQAVQEIAEEMPRDGYDTAVVGIPKTELAAGRNRNSVRIIGGKWRGRRVAFPDLPGLRPTPDRVRETLFNWLQHSLAGTRCLDLFAGSGALGLEALSRGARDVVFVEQAQLAARNLKAQLQHLDAFAEAHIMEMGAARYLRGVPQRFDIVFMDPPFGQETLAEFVPVLETGGWISAGSLVYLENEKTAGLPRLPSHWEVLKSKSAGEVGYHLARINGRIKANE
jgi:16S rRNA (guanine966-N2)-methyltransferase